MAVSPRSLFAGVVTDSPLTLYTAPGNTSTLIKAASVYNPGGTAIVFEVTLTPVSGGTSVVTSQVPVAALESLAIPELINHVIQAGGTIAAQTVADNANVIISGVEIV